jgi:hypothetical protein
VAATSPATLASARALNVSGGLSAISLALSVGSDNVNERVRSRMRTVGSFRDVRARRPWKVRSSVCMINDHAELAWLIPAQKQRTPHPGASSSVRFQTPCLPPHGVTPRAPTGPHLETVG